MTFREKLQAFPYSYETQEAGGARFRCLLAGKGRTVVLLNGGMNVSEMWMDYVEPLAAHYQVLLFDYPMELRTNQALVAGMDALFGKLGIVKPVLIGASDGGLVAQLYTRSHPDNVEALILLSTGGMDAQTIRSLRRRYFFAPALIWYMKHGNYDKNIKPKLIELGASHAKNDPPEVQARVREMFETLFEHYTAEKDIHVTTLLADLMHQEPVTPEDFAALKGRILLMLPEKDFFSPRMQQDLIELMHEPRVIMVDTGHVSTVLRPEEYTARILAFLSQIGVE